MQKYLNGYFFKTRNLQAVKVTLPEEVKGWFLLRKLSLDKKAGAMVLTATGGSRKYDVANKAVKSAFPQVSVIR